MNFDEMLEVWRAQDKASSYRVNPDLLLVVVQHEHADLRRESGWGLWFLPWALWMAASAMLAIVFLVFVVVVLRSGAALSVSDYVAGSIATGAMVVWPAVYWASYKRQPPRERGFGNSLREEIRRNLSRVDYHLSRYGRLAPSLLMFSPFGVVVSMFVWGSVRMNDGSFGWLLFFSIVWSMLLPLIWTILEFKKKLLAHRRRLSQLLELLNANE